jgi:hypothetical protein
LASVGACDDVARRRPDTGAGSSNSPVLLLVPPRVLSLAARHLGCGLRHGDTAQCMSTEACLSITLNTTRCWKEGSHFDHQQKARSRKRESVMSLQLFVTVLVICNSLFGFSRFLVGLGHASYSVRHIIAVISLTQEATKRVVSRQAQGRTIYVRNSRQLGVSTDGIYAGENATDVTTPIA